MKFVTLLAVALATIAASGPALAKGVACDNSDVMRPCANVYRQQVEPRRAKSTRTAARRSVRAERTFARAEPKKRLRIERGRPSGRVPQVSEVAFALPSGFGAVSRPARYVAGRLICAVNVNLALAERGIRGTGSALAKSFLGWGRSSGPVPGAVAVSGRRGGGHVAIVSRVEGSKVFVWNPMTKGRGWREVEYRHRAISYRVPG